MCNVNSNPTRASGPFRAGLGLRVLGSTHVTHKWNAQNTRQDLVLRLLCLQR